VPPTLTRLNSLSVPHSPVPRAVECHLAAPHRVGRERMSSRPPLHGSAPAAGTARFGRSERASARTECPVANAPLAHPPSDEARPPGDEDR